MSPQGPKPAEELEDGPETDHQQRRQLDYGKKIPRGISTLTFCVKEAI
jgi:hypothetical protein